MTVVMSNCKKKDLKSTEVKVKNMEIDVINNVTRVTNKPKLNQAIGKPGATGNFVLPGSPVEDIKEAENPIEIEMANCSISKSTQRATCGSKDCLKIKGGTHCARYIPFFLDINQKNMQRSMRLYFQG